MKFEIGISAEGRQPIPPKFELGSRELRCDGRRRAVQLGKNVYNRKTPKGPANCMVEVTHDDATVDQVVLILRLRR